MPTQSKESSLEIVPPVIVDENGDVQPYPSVASAIRSVEAVDVLNNEYGFYDSTGRVLEAHVLKGQVSLVPTSKLEADSAVLRMRMLRVLSLLGLAEESLASATFSELARLLFEKFEKKQK